MFVDKVKIKVKAGDGGHGAIAFRKEKYIDKGGPSGGDGGDGGSIIFKASKGLTTLMDFRFNKIIKAERGSNGASKNMHGRKGGTTIVKVPLGTVVLDAKTNYLIADISDDREVIIAKGGKGGKGNARFATSRNKAPMIAQNGLLGEERELQLELKVLADVGLVGFPSVGKSTFLSVVSSARPEVASYHFTTLSPNLGVVYTSSSKSFVLADLPGLIAGAHLGKGLGHEFLRHIERCRVIIHVIDMAASEGRDPYDDYLQITSELEKYNMRLLERPTVLVANKMDLDGATEELAKFKQKLNDNNLIIFPISSLTKTGLDQLLNYVATLVERTPTFPLDYTMFSSLKIDESDDINIIKEDGIWIIKGAKAEVLYQTYNISTEEGMLRFLSALKKLGIENKLKQIGAQDGDIVKIGDFEMEYME